MFDDTYLQTFIAECGEHLANVENDLIELEASGAKFELELVNRIFRAAHSIKGGSGFFDFVNIKELAHKLENVLDLIRTRSIEPNAEVVNILLIAFDKLRDLVSKIRDSNNIDISEEIVALSGLASSYLPASRKDEVVEMRRYPVGDDRVLEAGALQVSLARDAGQSIVVLRFDLIHDVQRMGRTPLSVLKELDASGNVLDCSIDFLAVGDLDAPDVADTIPFFVLMSTAKPAMALAKEVELPSSGVTVLEPARKPASKPKAVASDVEAEPDKAKESGKPSKTQKTQPEQVGTAEAERPGVVSAVEAESSVRIPVTVLDQLMNIAGELVLARNELLESIGSGVMQSVSVAGRRIDGVTREMQDAVMLTRMQPMSNLFNRYPRIIRDIARDSGKKIDLTVSGRDVEVDKNILELLSDPLTHLVRNACDHGIEPPKARLATGKPETGTLSLRARHEAGNVVVEVRDDGAGINVEAVQAKALGLKLITEERVKGMSEKEKAALILLPGLSTAKQVSDISGRGVGMDVVKTNIDRLGGQLEIITERGHGTAFRVKLPLTLAIIPSLLVSVSDERYAIPEANVEELLRVRVGDTKTRIERVGGQNVLVLRDAFLPIIRLGDVLEIPSVFVDPVTGEKRPDRRDNLADRRQNENDAQTSHPNRDGNDRRFRAASDHSVVVVNSATLRYALIVDELHDTMEIVVKPLGSHFAKQREYSGATILGNGTSALILDTTGLAFRAGLTSVDNGEAVASMSDAIEEEVGDDSALGLLLFGNGPDEPCVMRLEDVDRVLGIDRRQIQKLGKNRVYTMGSQSIPVYSLSDALEVSDALKTDGELALILANVANHTVGILATPPIDSLSTTVAIDSSRFHGNGLLGTAIVRGVTSMVVDVPGFIRTLCPDWFGPRKTGVNALAGAALSEPIGAKGPVTSTSTASNLNGPLILLAEDSDFFRAKVSGTIEEGGYRVLAAPDGPSALKTYETHDAEIVAVVTDIEMPGFDGYELARRLRQKTPSLPIIALTALATDDDRAAALSAGVTEYQVKLDPDALLAALGRLIASDIALKGE